MSLTNLITEVVVKGSKGEELVKVEFNPDYTETMISLSLAEKIALIRQLPLELFNKDQVTATPLSRYLCNYLVKMGDDYFDGEALVFNDEELKGNGMIIGKDAIDQFGIEINYQGRIKINNPAVFEGHVL